MQEEGKNIMARTGFVLFIGATAFFFGDIFNSGTFLALICVSLYAIFRK
jgi:hypothetical protein